jgi:CBS domain-containing protein
VRARDLVEPFPTVALDTDALQAARTIGEHRLPGLIVCDETGAPHTVLPGSQVLRFLIPPYIQEDMALARVYDESASERLLGKLSTKTVRDLLPRHHDRDQLPVVDADATTLEMAALMARLHSPVVAVVDEGVLLGAVTVSRLFQHLFPSGDPSPGSPPGAQ